MLDRLPVWLTPTLSIALLAFRAARPPCATTKETFTINANDLPALANDSKPIARAKVCAPPMLPCNCARNAIRLLHILNDRANGSPWHEALCVL
jgi:hypothetical protein